MAIRTAERRAYLTGEGQKRQEWGISLVIVNKRGGHPCPQCAKWCGKILIDDVYSGGKPDGKHQLLSEAMQQGFLHPRCKDGVTTYFPGVTSVPDPVSREELQEAAQDEAEENREAYARRQAEKYDRMAKYSLDPENKRKYAARAEEWRESAGEANITVAKPVDSGIIATEKTGEVADVTDFCELDRQKIAEEFPALPNSRVVLTDERIKHIKDNHPEDLVFFEKYGVLTITDPEYILLDAKNPMTVMYVRSVESTNLNVIVRLALADDMKNGKSHSVMTSYCLGAKTLKRLKKKNKTLYIRE